MLLLCNIPLGIFILVIIPYKVNGNGGFSSGNFANLKTRIILKKNTRDAKECGFSKPTIVLSPTRSSPSTARVS